MIFALQIGRLWMVSAFAREDMLRLREIVSAARKEVDIISEAVIVSVVR